MSEFKTLAAMGLTDTSSIHRFSLSEKNGQDLLKVQLDQPENSVLPSSTSFSFKQDDIAQQQMKLAAVAELTQLTRESTRGDKEKLEELEADIDRMEAIMRSKLDEMRQEVKNIF